jgi:hypothetical protein
VSTTVSWIGGQPGLHLLLLAPQHRAGGPEPFGDVGVLRDAGLPAELVDPAEHVELTGVLHPVRRARRSCHAQDRTGRPVDRVGVVDDPSRAARRLVLHQVRLVAHDEPSAELRQFLHPRPRDVVAADDHVGRWQHPADQRPGRLACEGLDFQLRQTAADLPGPPVRQGAFAQDHHREQATMPGVGERGDRLPEPDRVGDQREPMLREPYLSGPLVR